MGKTIEWDEFEQGEIPTVKVKFEKPNDSIVGVVTNVRVTDFGGTSERTPELWIQKDDGIEVSVAAGQVMLRRGLASARPAVGDRIAIVYTGDGKSSKAGMSPPKLFDIKVVRAGESAGTPVVAQPDTSAVAAEPAAATADSLI